PGTYVVLALLVVLLRARIISLASGTPRNRGQLTAPRPATTGRAPRGGRGRTAPPRTAAGHGSAPGPLRRGRPRRAPACPSDCPGHAGGCTRCWPRPGLPRGGSC